jgi:hypothetical protein
VTRFGVGGHLARDDHVRRHAYTTRLEQLLAVRHPIGLDERIADRISLRLQERERHRAADEQRVDPLQQRVDDTELVADLGAAEQRNERALGVSEQPAERLDLGRQEPAGRGGHDARWPHDRRVRAVRRAERIVDVHVAELAQVRGEAGLVGLLTGIEPQVLDHHDVAGTEALCAADRTEPRDLGRQLDFGVEQLAQPPRDGRERVSRINLALGASEMRAQHDRRAALAQPQERRKRRGDAQVIVDLAVAQRDVEIGAHQDTRALAQRE